jgi:hypothetical protein
MWSMRASLGRSVFAAWGLAVLLAGCSASSLVDQLPPSVGLPANVPAQPVVAYQYPAVHDMPPTRATKPMSAEQQLQMEQQLTNLRERQEKRYPSAKTSKKTAKKPVELKKFVKKNVQNEPAAPVPLAPGSPGSKANP